MGITGRQPEARAGITGQEELAGIVAEADAPAKAILFGEHAVVYGRPALAIPLSRIRAHARVTQAVEGVTLRADDLGLEHRLGEGAADHRIRPLVDLAVRTGEELGVPLPPLTVTLRSEIPIARGLGSGAAVGTALVRGLSRYLRRPLSADSISDLVYEAEVTYHGTPSGLDNAVIALERPIFFSMGRAPVSLELGSAVTVVLGDTGVESHTREIVQEVRLGWCEEQARYEAIFDQIGDLSQQGRGFLEAGSIEDLGEAMNRNQSLLVDLGVSSGPIDRLVSAARAAGAAGAKLSGAGRGGCVVALVSQARDSREVAAALEAAGASWVAISEAT